VSTTYNQALLDRATAYVGQPLTARRYDAGLTEISALYAEITGDAVGKCRQCQYKDFLAVVTAYIREATRLLHPETVQDSKYTFAPGFQAEVIADGRYSKAVTAENLTDEDAEALIKLGYPHVIVLKPGQEAVAEGETEQGDGEPAQPEPTEREKELEQELAQTKSSLTEYQTNYTQAIDGLKKESEAHKATKAELTKVKRELTTLKNHPVAPAAPATEPTATTSTSTEGAAPAAPAVPSAPADGTQA
jgi:hypothetical protein